MTDYHWIPSKIKPYLFTSCFNRANDRAKFNYWGGRKTLLFFCLWSDDIDIVKTMEVLQNSLLGGTDQKCCSFWPAEALAKNWCQ